MATEDGGDPIAPNLRVLQIIAISLVLGVSIFLVVTVAILRSGKPLLAPDPWGLDPGAPISLAAILMAVAVVPAAFLVPRAIANANRRALARGQDQGQAADDRATRPTGEIGGLLAIFQTQLIIGAALLEGAAFMATIAFMQEGKAIVLILAIGLVALMLARFPSRAKVEAWLEEQRRLLADERQGG